MGAVAPVVWGTTYLVTTELLPPGHPMTASVLRALPAGLALVALTRSWPRQWDRLVVLALLNIGAFFPLLFVAAYRLPGGIAAVVGAGQPFVVAVATWVLWRRRTSVHQLGWAVAALVGVAMTVLTGTLVVDVVGLGAAVLGTASMALGIALTREWGATEGLSGLASTGWQLLLAGVMMLPLVPVVDHGPWVLTAPAIAGYAWLGVVGGALAYALWFHAARRLPPTSTALLGPLSPITAALLGWVVLGQSLTPLQGIGFVLALAASVLGQRRRPAAGDPLRPHHLAVRTGLRLPWVR